MWLFMVVHGTSSFYVCGAFSTSSAHHPFTPRHHQVMGPQVLLFCIRIVYATLIATHEGFNHLKGHPKEYDDVIMTLWHSFVISWNSFTYCLWYVFKRETQKFFIIVARIGLERCAVARGIGHEIRRILSTRQILCFEPKRSSSPLSVSHLALNMFMCFILFSRGYVQEKQWQQ